MKKFISYFAVILCSTFFIFLMASKPVEAVYDRDKNKASISVNKDEIRINVTYQRGFGVGNDISYYKWCEKKGVSDTVEPDCDAFQLPDGDHAVVENYVSVGGDSNISYISKGDAKHADNNLTMRTFVINKDKDPILKENLNDYAGKKFVIIVQTLFCAVRTETGGEYNSCQFYDPEKTYISIEVDVNALRNSSSINSEIENKDIETMMEKIENIVNGTVMPIIWTLLGIFLIIKGTLLGMQIVKAADEPQVRQEKVGSLKWLVIGVAIAYGTSFVVTALISFLEKTF